MHTTRGRSRRRVRWGAVLVLPAGLSLTGCAQQGDVAAPTPQAAPTIVTRVQAPLPPLPHGAASWPAPRVSVEGNTIAVGGRTSLPEYRSTRTVRRYDVSPLRADQVVSTRGGIYFLNAGELWFLGNGSARSTAFTDLSRIVVSSDGRYLGLVDRNHGAERPGHGRLAAAVVYDTVSGRAVERSDVGMGSLGQDLAARYATSPPVPISFRGRALIVTTPDGTYRYPFGGHGSATKIS